MLQTALLIKKESLGIFSLAASIRLRKLLEQFKITEDQIEKLLEVIEKYCFKQGIAPKDFVLKIGKIADLAIDFKIPLYKIPAHIDQL
jgi:hypothetical protein